MKKTITAILAMLMMFTAVGCGSKTEPSAPSDGEKPAIESALDFYNKVWDAFDEADKFPCGGGDMNHDTEGPGLYELTEGENAEMFQYLLHVTPELYDMLDNDAATLQHMMNTNTFSSAVAKLKDPAKAAEFAEAYKTAVQEQQWMCGFPDKVVVISVGDYVVMAYGAEENINSLMTACSEVEPSSVVLVDDAAMLD